MSELNPEAARAAMAAELTAAHDALVDRGAIQGEKINIPGPSPAPAPTPEPAAPAPTAETAPAQAPVPAVPFDKNIHGLGKYNSLEELRKGYHNAVQALSSTADELSALRAQVQQAPVNPQPQFLAPTVPAGVPGGSPRVNPAARNPIDLSSDPVIAKLAEETSVPKDLLVQAFENVAAAASSRAEEQAEAVRDQLANLQKMSEAEAYMRTKYPDSANHAVEVTNFVKTTPQVAQAVAALAQAGAPAQAMEYAYTMYMAQTGIGLERRMVANAEVAEEERVQARADAGLPTSPNTGVMAALPSNNAPTAEEIAALNEAAGPGLSDTQAAIVRRRLMLSHMLPPELRTWENR